MNGNKPGSPQRSSLSFRIGGQDFPIKRLSDIDAFFMLAGISVTVIHPAWDAETIRTRLTALLEWIDEQPVTGMPIPVASSRWLFPWPMIPRSHPLHAVMKRTRSLVSSALTLVDIAALEEAQKGYCDAVKMLEYVSDRLAEPYAATGLKIHAAGAYGGDRELMTRQNQAERSAAYQAAVDDLASKRPGLSYAAIMDKVARANGVSLSTIKRHTHNPRKPR